MLKVTSRWPHQESIKVEWNIGKRCNYDCSYCPSAIHDNFSTHANIDILKKAAAQLINLGKPIRISFTGGEPTVHPKFLDLVEYCKDIGVNWISVTTNGTLPAEFYRNLPIEQILFSIHFEYDWTRVVDTIKKVHSFANVNIIAQIMALDSKMDQVLQARAIMLQDHIPNTIRRIRWIHDDRDVFDDMRYNLRDLKWIKEQEATIKENTVIFLKEEPDAPRLMHANDIIKLHMNKYKGWTCNAGIESLMINWDGNVHRATCRVGGSLGNIYEGNFVAPSKPVTCDRNFCTCAADIPITKYENN
jgi:hypothetical protein